MGLERQPDDCRSRPDRVLQKMRPGDPATLENARGFLEEQLFDQRHYDLERVGRYKLNQKLDLDIPITHRNITKLDIIRLVRRMILINNEVEAADDIDHLGNRRVKTVGELIQNKLRIGLRRMERVIKERMSIRDQEQLSPVTLVNIRPVVAALREFFGSASSPSLWIKPTHWPSCVTNAPFRQLARAACAANEPVSMSVMSTTLTMAAFARLKRLKALTLA